MMLVMAVATDARVWGGYLCRLLWNRGVYLSSMATFGEDHSIDSLTVLSVQVYCVPESTTHCSPMVGLDNSVSIDDAVSTW